jgi:hypothetical protein
MELLRISLLSNAIFSFITGLSLLIFNSFLSTIMVLPDIPLMIVGIGLLLFSSLVGFESKMRRKNFVLFIISQDLLWIAASAYLLIFNPFGISSAGNSIILAIGVIVLVFSIGQSIGLYSKLKD